MNVGGLSKRIVNLSIALLGHRRGGMGFVTILAAVILSSLSGSAVADAAALTALLMPMMRKSGTDAATAGGLIASSSVIGPVIPPSIAFILYGVVGGVSITQLFLAGIVPGLLLAVALCVTWFWMSRKDNAPLPPKADGKTRLLALRDSLWALMLPVIIIVGLRFGVFTPTEAGVVAAVYSLFVAMVVYREIGVKDLFTIFANAAMTTSVVMFLVAAAAVSAWLITIAQVPAQLVAMLDPFMDNPTLLLIVIMLIVLAVGTAMDLTPTILILTPVLMPVLKQAGIDPVYFGVLFVINNSIGLITPPVGTVLNVVCGISKLSYERLAKGVLPFLLAQVLVLLLMILFPQLVTVPMSWFIHK
jgi:tripartite ATP-independent transporter DctM subunit